MLHCIWHKTLGERVVDTEEFNRLLNTGDYFKTLWEAKKSLEDKDHEKANGTRHNLHSAPIKANDDQSKANGGSGHAGVQSGNGEQRSTRTRICKKSDKRNRCSISGEVINIQEMGNDASHENDQ